MPTLAATLRFAPMPHVIHCFAFCLLLCVNQSASSSWIHSFNDSQIGFGSRIAFSGDARIIEAGGFASGYLSLNDAVPDQSGLVAFPMTDICEDSEGFRVSMLVRVGAGTDQPGDGFSVNLARADAPLLQAIDFEVPSIEAETRASFLSARPDESSPVMTQTGIAVGFNTWQEASNGECGSANSCAGISVRLDEELLARVPFPTLNGTFDDATSLQTGTSGTVDELGWAELQISLVRSFPSRTTSELYVSYKDRIVYEDTIPLWSEPLHLLIGGTTGSNSSHHHFDDIFFITVDAFQLYGDVDEDGALTYSDFLTLAGNMNTTNAAYVNGDLDFDGDVDLTDFALFRFEWSKTVVTSVPEPAMNVVLVIGVVTVFRRRSFKAT